MYLKKVLPAFFYLFCAFPLQGHCHSSLLLGYINPFIIESNFTPYFFQGKTEYVLSDHFSVLPDPESKWTDLLLIITGSVPPATLSTENQNLRTEIKILKAREKKYLLFLFGLLSSLILMAALTYLFTKRQRRTYSIQKNNLTSEKQQLSTEKQEIESELKEAAAQLYAFTMSIWEKNKLIASYTEELKKNSGLSGIYYQQDHAQNVQQLIQATLLTDEQWDSFRHLFDKVYPGYQLRLHDQLPGLSPAETRYMLLRKLNLSNKEMAAMLGVGADSVRQYRSRLRKKYNITEEEKLEELVAAI